MAFFIVGLAPSWGSPRSGSCPPPPTGDLQWVYIGLRWPSGGLGCVGCLLGIVYLHRSVVAAEVCGCEFWWVDIFILFLVLRWVEVDGIWLNLIAWLWVFSSGLRWVEEWVFVGFC